MADNAGSSDRLWTPSNIITITRICLVPTFVAALITDWTTFFNVPELYEYKCWVAALIFILISCTDWLDGYLARSRNEVTDFGKFMDPLADKILVAAALLALIELGTLPSWVAIIILLREFIVSGVRMIAATKGEVIAASYYGKFKTVFQMIAIVLFTIKDSSLIANIDASANSALNVFSWVIMIIALILTVFSMLDYIVKARSIIGLDGGSSASKETTSATEASLANEGFDEVDVKTIRDFCVDNNFTVCTAESCTGGLIGKKLTDISGASKFYYGGVIAYANEEKVALLSVDPDAIDRFGAVSQEVAAQMAEGARSALNCDYSVAVTGIAGPDGATPTKPLGTVWISASSTEQTSTKLFSFSGDRDAVREKTSKAALSMLWSIINS